jgi:hypothetical protein
MAATHEPDELELSFLRRKTRNENPIYGHYVTFFPLLSSPLPKGKSELWKKKVKRALRGRQIKTSKSWKIIWKSKFFRFFLLFAVYCEKNVFFFFWIIFFFYQGGTLGIFWEIFGKVVETVGKYYICALHRILRWMDTLMTIFGVQEVKLEPPSLIHLEVALKNSRCFRM